MKKSNNTPPEILGYTKSGKPIYKGFNYSKHAKFNKEDHLDAAELNQLLGRSLSIKSFERSGYEAHANCHIYASTNLKETKERLKALANYENIPPTQL